MQTVIDGLLQEVASNQFQVVVLGEVVQVEWSPDIEQGVCCDVRRVEARWLTVDEESVAMLRLAGGCKWLVDDDGGRVLVGDAEGLSITNGPVVEVLLSAWGAIKWNVWIDLRAKMLVNVIIDRFLARKRTKK